MVAWAVEVPAPAADAPPARVVSDAVHFTMPLTRVGSGGLYAGVATLAHGEAFTWHFEAADRRLGGGQLEVYETHPDSRERPGVPKGTLKQMPAVGEQDLRRHEARLVGLRARAVPGRDARPR